MVGRVVLDRRFVVVDLDAKLGGVAEQRLELGGDRRVVGAGESGGGKSRRRRGREQLNDERKRNDKGGQGRAERRHAAPCPPVPKRECLAREACQNTPSMLCLVAERVSERNKSTFVDRGSRMIRVGERKSFTHVASSSILTA